MSRTFLAFTTAIGLALMLSVVTGGAQQRVAPLMTTEQLPLAAAANVTSSVPIVFVHGFCATPSTWDDMASGLSAQDSGRYGTERPHALYFDGVSVKSADGQSLGSITGSTKLFAIRFWADDLRGSQSLQPAAGFNTSAVADRSIQEKGGQLQRVIADIRARTGASKVILVGHSQGGLVSRAYVQDVFDRLQHVGYQDDVAGIITIDTPHLGSGLARFQELQGFFENILKFLRPDLYWLLSTAVDLPCLGGISVDKYQLQPPVPSNPTGFLSMLNARPEPNIPMYSITSWSNDSVDGDGVVSIESQNLRNVYSAPTSLVRDTANQIEESLWEGAFPICTDLSGQKVRVFVA